MAYGIDVDKNFMKIVYYMMMADGEIADSEMGKFNEIGKNCTRHSLYGNISSFDSDRKEIVSECKNQMEKSFDDSDYMEVLKEGVLESIKASRFDDFGKRNLLWMLVNMSFADGDCSKKEEELLRYVARQLEIGKAYLCLAEMEDTAKALLALENKKKWAENSTMPYNEVKVMIDEIEKDLDILVQSKNTLVSIG